MKRLLLMSSVLLAMLVLPALASATHITDLVAMGDCDGFNAQVDIHFRSTCDALDLHYEVAVLDEDSMEVVMVSGDLVVVKENSQDVSVLISDAFNTALDGEFVISGMISLFAPYPGGVDEEMVTFENIIQCGSVATDATSFENLKAMYR